MEPRRPQHRTGERILLRKKTKISRSAKQYVHAPPHLLSFHAAGVAQLPAQGRPSPSRGVTTPPGWGSSWALVAEATNQKEFISGTGGGGRKQKRKKGMNRKKSMEPKMR